MPALVQVHRAHSPARRMHFTAQYKCVPLIQEILFLLPRNGPDAPQTPSRHHDGLHIRRVRPTQRGSAAGARLSEIGAVNPCIDRLATCDACSAKVQARAATQQRRTTRQPVVVAAADNRVAAGFAAAALAAAVLVSAPMAHADLVSSRGARTLPVGRRICLETVA